MIKPADEWKKEINELEGSPELYPDLTQIILMIQMDALEAAKQCCENNIFPTNITDLVIKARINKLIKELK